MTNLLTEALVVGLVSAIVGLIVSTLLMYAFSKDFSLKKYDFWPQVALSYFITGIVLHLGFEWVGANKWYCKHGNACK
jgi:ABC-type antimicrobial peptide transport system permease subunit